MIVDRTSRVNFEDMEAHFEDYVDRAEGGETFEIVRNEKVVALLTPPWPDRA